MTVQERHEYAEELLQELLQRAPLANRPALLWKGMRVSAGMAYYKLHAIGLSSRILDAPEKIRDTLVHEYAHLLAFERFGPPGAGHGRPWRDAMRELGADPKVRHTYEVQRNSSRQRVVYQCRKCGTHIVRRRRLPRWRHYVHAACGGGLKLLKIEKITRDGIAA